MAMPGVHSQEAHQHAEQSGLPGTVRAHQGGDLTSPSAEVNAVEDLMATPHAAVGGEHAFGRDGARLPVHGQLPSRS